MATFTQALVTHLCGAGADVGIVRVVDAPQPDEPLVAHQLVTGRPGAESRAAAALNSYDVAVIQHEYGIFGGPDGADVLRVLAETRVPVISVLHTVLTEPTPNQWRVLDEVVEASSLVVTMTRTARQRLLDGWDVPQSKVIVIAHGAEDNRATARRRPVPVGPIIGRRRPTILTWGLIGQGKGIEWALEAMTGLADLDPRPRYQVVGQTHPRVLEREGEAYRRALLEQVAGSGLAESVHFDNRYLDGASLRAIVRAADIILLPYDSRDQVTSGVLTEAVVAGKPVVSTSFPHAIELLGGGAGLLVPQRDPSAITGALRRVLTEPGLADGMAAMARELAPGLLWPAVARHYIQSARQLTARATESVA